MNVTRQAGVISVSTEIEVARRSRFGDARVVKWQGLACWFKVMASILTATNLDREGQVYRLGADGVMQKEWQR